MMHSAKQYIQYNKCAACEQDIVQPYANVCLSYRSERAWLCVKCFQQNAPDELIEILGMKENIFAGPIKSEINSMDISQQLSKSSFLVKPAQKPRHFVNVSTNLSQTTQYYCILCDDAINVGLSQRIPNSFKIRCNSCGGHIEEVYYEL